MLAALPSGSRPAGPALVTIAILAVPYLAGMLGGFVTVRIAPTPTIEAAPLWGFVAGAATGALAGLAAAFSGGPLGDGRLAAVGPSGWQVGLVAVLQIGVTAALTAAAANWLILRRVARRRRPGRPRPTTSSAPRRRSGRTGRRAPVAAGSRTGFLVGVVDEREDASGHRIFLNPWAEPDDRTPSRPTAVPDRT